MSALNTTNMNIGEAQSPGFVEAAGLEGSEAWFDNGTPTDASTKRNALMRKCRLVKNASGGTLLPNLVVKRLTTTAITAQTQVGGVAGATDIPFGVVNDQLPSTGVAANDYFWMVVSGPNLVTSSAAVTAGVIVATATGGKSANASSPPTDNDFGVALEAASGASEDKLVDIKL